MKFLFVVALLTFATAQDSDDDLINSIFSPNGTSNDFLANYEEVTPLPLKSVGALTRCGEGEQENSFVCVPYYNCDPNTKSVIENPDVDGTNKIDIRMGEENSKCNHYLEVCCRLSDGTDGGSTSEGTTSRGTTSRGTTQTPISSGRPTTQLTTSTTSEDDNRKPQPVKSINCGIRNAQGLDFNVVGSNNEANFGEFPWMVAILRKNPNRAQNLAICGGSLIGPGVVLTGAHCVQNISVNDIKIRAGEWDTQTQNERIPYQERNVIQKVVHSHFLKNNLYNDIALLILDRNLIKTDSVGTVCLPQQDQKFNSHDCFATGWGKQVFGKEGRYSVILKKIQMPLVHNANCQTALRTTRLGTSFVLHKSFICAGGEPNVDTCTGDGGSPLVCPDPNNPSRYLQVGIVAWGIGCGERQVPGVYVDVGSFRNWVDLKLQELGISSASYVK